MNKFKDIDVIEAIEIMKQHIIDGRMSLLVGAGASCCACELYNTWFGLIKDMVVFLYADELKAKGIKIIEDKKYYCHYIIEKARNNSKIDIDSIIKNIIEREGVLQIPSQFEKRTGLRESVEAYIESHTPQLDINKNTATLFGKSVPLTSSVDFIASMLRVNWNAIFTTNYDNMLEHVALMAGMEKFKESNSAADLSLRNMREMIIKLHGSIDFKHESNGFDSDKHRKYIITKEDYEDYPAKHEAFMQLMRISLLKDCLCIVGFSGKDANFIAWINWVREIIEMNPLHKTNDYPQAKDIKVFFIDARDGIQDDATKQYFENHRIYRILLTEDKVTNLFCTEIPDEKSPERGNILLKAFFEYLNTDVINNQPQQDNDTDITIKEQNSEQQRLIIKSEEVKKSKDTDLEKQEEQHVLHDTFGIWSKAYKLTGKHLTEINIDENTSNQLISYRSYLRLVKNIHYQSTFINAIARKQKYSELEAEMALMALEQMQEDPYEEHLSIINKIEDVLKKETYLDRINRLKSRHFTLVNPLTSIEGSSDMIIYEQCLRNAFTFEFGQLKDILNAWLPSEDFIIKKLTLLSIVDTKTVNGILSQSLLDKIHPTVERFRATQLANILSGNIPGTYSVDEFVDLSQHSILSLRDWYFGDLIQPRERIYAYGTATDDGNGINKENATRCLNFMIEAPIMPQINIWSIISSVQWYKVAHALFEKYPYPVLFYSSTVNDSNTLKRIGQDFAYSKVLHDQLPEFTIKMFNLITNNKQTISYWTFRNISIILCEIIKAVPSSYWDAFLLKLWKEYYLPKFEETHRNDAIYKLICSCLSCTINEELAIMVINDSLNSVKENGKYHLVQDLFYYLRTQYSRKISTAITPALIKFISKIDNDKDFILLGNLYRVINKSLYRKITEKIPSSISSLSGIKSSSINGLIYFAKSDNKTLKFVKNALLNSKLLWGNGILANGGIAPTNFIPIVDLDDTLNWTNEEIHIVYSKLVASSRQFLQRINGNDFVGIMHYESLLYEMMRFIDLHRKELCDEKGVGALYNKLDEKYKQLTDYIDLEKSIFSDSDNEMEACLDALAIKVKKEGIYCHIAHINVLVTRLLCRNVNSYQKVLDYMQYYVRYYLKTKDDMKLIPQLPLLMDKLTLDEFRSLEQNVIFCAELSILMAEKLQELGLDTQGIKYWIQLKNKRYFNWSICDNIED